MSTTPDTTLIRIQTDPASGIAQAFFQTTVDIGGEKFAKPLEQVNWSLFDTESTVTVGDLTLTYAQVSAFALAIAHKARADVSAT